MKLLVATILLAGGAQLPDAYTLQFENEWVKVTRVYYAPRVKLQGHAHTVYPAAYVYLNDSGPIIFRHVGDKPFQAVRPETKAGSFRVFRSIEEIHEVENTTDAPSHFLRVEFKTDPKDVSTLRGRFHREPLSAADNADIVQFENDQVRIRRLVLYPGHSFDMTTPARQPALLIALTASAPLKLGVGSSRWVPGGQQQAWTHTGTAPLELLRFDFKTRPLRPDGAPHPGALLDRAIDGVLTTTLCDLGQNILNQISRYARVSIGFEEYPPRDDQGVLPVEGRTVLTGLTVREAMNILVGLDPRYHWVESRGIIVVRPVKAWGDRKHFLNLPIQDFHVEDRDPVDVMFALANFMHSGVLRLPDVPSAVWVPLTFAVQSGSILDAMNEMARAGELSWHVSYDSPPRQGGGGTMLSWRHFEKNRGGGVWPMVPPPRWLEPGTPGSSKTGSESRAASAAPCQGRRCD